jgi:hypothetical protein
MESLAEPKKTKYCASCGSPNIGGRTSNLSGAVRLCVGCTVRMRSGLRLDYRLPTRDDSLLPVEERFNELFTAARVLLKENAEENRIIPTLALANEIGQGRPHLITEKQRLLELGSDKQIWDEEANSFTRRYGGLRPVRVEQEILVLEKLPVFVAVGYAMVRKTPEEVVISVYPHRRLATFDEVTSRYEKVLSDAGVSYGEPKTGSLSFSFYGRTLELRVQPGTIIERLNEPQGSGYRIDKASFPHPRLVGEFYNVLLSKAGGGFRGELAMRTAGDPPEAENLVPACVAFLLRTYGLEGRKEIHQLLNKHVLCEIGKELQLGYTDNATYTLWRRVTNEALVRTPLVDAAWTLFYEGYEYE